MGTIITADKWETPVSIYPEASSGKFNIVKKRARAGTTWETGEASGIDEVLFVAPITFTILQDYPKRRQGIPWMSDTPMEYYQANDLVTRTTPGRVLLGGLGLGLITHLLARRTDIKEIVVVEIEPDVIKLVSPYLPPKVEVIEGDFLKKLVELRDSRFDTVIADLWKTGYEDGDKELYNDARMAMEDWHPEARHLFWAFQKMVDEENTKLAIHNLYRSGIPLEVHQTDGDVIHTH